ncbi:MAG: restriction endonuclease subunit S [Bacteroidales bacterium]|nr:restriction endonuclease subunit S [Bacteroidales bacterium]
MSCKQESYKRLGDYIREVDVRNSDLKITKLYGVNLQKEFMPSVANTIGTDMSRYKVISYNQFGCKLMSVERDKKMPISLMKDKEPAIMSSAYYVFEVKNENILLPDYLFMQIKSPEFDRRLWFGTGGDVRGGATWEGLCDMPIIVPSIAEQQGIVDQYNAIQYRIENNKKTIAKLEETTQAIYRKMFVDDIDPENLPDGWRMGSLSDIVSFKVGGDKPFIFSEIKTNICNTPIYSNGVENEGLYGYTDKPAVSEESVTVSARGNVGSCFVRRFPYFGIVRLISLIPNKKNILYYLFYNLSRRRLQGDGSAQSQITVPQLKDEEIIIPEDNVLNSFYEMCTSLRNHIDSNKRENLLLNNMLSIISF